MKRKLALSFLFVFTLGLSTPVMSNSMMQEPEKEECEKKCDKEEKEKKDCDKKAEKKDCDKDKDKE
ncbi:MAG: hypothetical protein R6U46_11170 [Marinilabilia sp.]